MKYYDEIYSEIVPFKFIKYVVYLEGGIGLVFLIMYIMQLTGNMGVDDELSSVFFLIMAIIMLFVAAFTASFRKLKIGITPDLLRASFGFTKFEVPFSSVSKVYVDEKSSLRYGGWGVKMRKYKEGWVLAYATIGHKRVVLELEKHKCKKFIFSTAHPEEVVNVVKQRIR